MAREDDIAVLAGLGLVGFMAYNTWWKDKSPEDIFKDIDTKLREFADSIFSHLHLPVPPQQQQIQQPPGGAGTPTVQGPQPPAGAATAAAMTLGFNPTGKKVAMNVGKNPSGQGQRYNCNHNFTNYVMSGLFQNATTQELIEMKTDGPNHSGCSQVPRCAWFEPHFLMNGKTALGMEMPHTPRKDYVIQCPSCKSIPGNYLGKWIGYAVAAYGPKGGRVVEQWVDPTGTGTKWQLTLRERVDARFHEAQNRDLPLEGRGLEAEIRMHGAGNKEHGQPGGTNMKNAFVYEINPPGTATIRNQMLNEPYLFNGYYAGRRL